jgi:hypothetical protein
LNSLLIIAEKLNYSLGERLHGERERERERGGERERERGRGRGKEREEEGERERGREHEAVEDRRMSIGVFVLSC